MAGCCCTALIGEMEPPANGVQIQINQALSDQQNDDAKARLESLVEGTTSTSSIVLNGKATFNISPVEDPQAFADSIDFGTVTSVEGRVIHLDVAEGDL